MGRFDTRMRQPPVRIGKASARVLQDQLTDDVQRTARGAGNFGARERRFASVGLRLVIQKSAGPNTATARGATLPLGRTARKRGYPPITLTGE